MTDRYYALTIVLEKDIRSDDAERLIDAIHMLRGVLSVAPNVSDSATWMAEERAKSELRNKIFEALK